MALVSHDHKFIFLKTAKTAGTSVEMFLEAMCTGAQAPVSERTHARETERLIVGMRLVEKADRIPLDKIWYNHMPASEIRNLLGQRTWDSYRTITTVRNPFDLVVSRFHWTAERRGDPPLPRSPERQRAEFTDFVKGSAFPSSADITHLDGAFAIHHVVRFEHLREDLHKLCGNLGRPYEPALLTHVKATAWRRFGVPVHAYYTPETEEIVCKEHGWMFDCGGYSRSAQDIAAEVCG